MSLLQTQGSDYRQSIETIAKTNKIRFLGSWELTIQLFIYLASGQLLAVCSAKCWIWDDGTGMQSLFTHVGME